MRRLRRNGDALRVASGTEFGEALGCEARGTEHEHPADIVEPDPADQLPGNRSHQPAEGAHPHRDQLCGDDRQEQRRRRPPDRRFGRRRRLRQSRCPSPSSRLVRPRFNGGAERRLVRHSANFPHSHCRWPGRLTGTWKAYPVSRDIWLQLGSRQSAVPARALSRRGIVAYNRPVIHRDFLRLEVST